MFWYDNGTLCVCVSLCVCVCGVSIKSLVFLVSFLSSSMLLSLSHTHTHTQEGTKRYNCVECEGSYDLCSKCYKNGVAKAHTRDLGPLHTFVTERMSAFEIASLVHTKTLEGTIRNMFQ